MTITEKQMDLFDAPRGYSLAHCISADFALGAGIAVAFNDRYNMRERLSETYNYCSEDFETGCSFQIDEVYNLVTKKKAFHKPTYNNLADALYELKEQLEENGVTKLAIPKIGCGLDRLDWNEVKSLIEEIFEDTDIEILVCYLD